MNDLISRKVLYEEIARLEELARNRVLDTPSTSPCYARYSAQLNERTSLKHIIANAPTAFDVDKVVERLEENGQKMSEAKSNTPYGKSTPGCHNYYKAISVKRAIEIVKGGGVDE